MPDVYIIPDPLQMVLQLVATFIMFLAVKKFLWGSVTKFIEEKRELSVAEINEAKVKNKEAEELLVTAESTIKEARDKANEIVGESKKSADAVHDRIILDAKKEADYLKANAKESIEQEKLQFYDSLKNEVVDLTMIATSKIIKEEIDEKKQKDIVDSLIEGVS
ncbi:MAG: F0F1 ATP synthase subunit B [Bacilli bacterium]